MSKMNYYRVHSSNGNEIDDISFYKENGIIYVHMGYEELAFTIKEAKEIIDKMKQCVKD